MIIHLSYATTQSVCRAFLRIQEFYESPEFAGKYFTVDEYATWYTADRGKFSYYDDWSGFNIPGNVVREFFVLFKDLSDEEKVIYSHVNHIWHDNFYLIGNASNDADTLEHECRHALFYLDPVYRYMCDLIFKSSQYELPKDILLDMGYSDKVIPDEMQAYFACPDTNEQRKYLAKHFISQEIVDDLISLYRPAYNYFKESKIQVQTLNIQ